MSRYQDALARNDLDETESVEQETPEAEPVHEEEGGPSNDPVRMYLKRLGDVPLLTREGEVAVGWRCCRAISRLSSCSRSRSGC